jgi:hypothetical protein
MHAWVSCFGKPLLCIIAGIDGMRGYRFDDDRAVGVELAIVQVFPRGLIVGVDLERPGEPRSASAQAIG